MTRRVGRGGIRWHLTRQNNPAIRFHRMREECNWARSRVEQMKLSHVSLVFGRSAATVRGCVDWQVAPQSVH